MDKKIGCAFIGAGEISFLQAKAVKACGSAELIGLWNRTVATGAKRAAEEGCRCYGSAEELLADRDVDAVFVLTNLESHLKYAKMAMDAGKHVLCEKPLSGSVGEIEEMYEYSKRTGRICMPGHNMIHEESIHRARALIQNGELGKIVSCYVMYNIRHSEERASTLPGVVRHILTHNLYTMIYLVGNPTRICGFKANRHYQKIDKEDITLAVLQLENGGLAHLCASFAADDLSSAPWTFTVRVIGTEGTTNYTYNDWVAAGHGISHSHTYDAYQQTINNEVRFFIDRCILNGESPPSTLADAIVCQKATEALEKSIREGMIVDIT